MDRDLVISASMADIAVGPYMEVFLDEDNLYSPEMVASEPFNDRFGPSAKEIPGFGHTSGTPWVRFRLRNPTDQSITLYIENRYAAEEPTQ